jgi:hypothetical protein
VIYFEDLLSPGHPITMAAIELTGTAAVLKNIPPERIQVMEGNKMKITKRQLRQLIHEAMAADRGVELTEPGANEASISAAWPDKVYYNGESVFETFYSDAAMNAAWEYVEDNGFDDGQEAYLGYSPSTDTFIMGFDAWEQGVDTMSGVLIRMTPDGRPVAFLAQAPGGIYPAGRNEAKRRYPDIIEVRLD